MYSGDEPLEQRRCHRRFPLNPFLLTTRLAQRQRPDEPAQQQPRHLRLAAQVRLPLLTALQRLVLRKNARLAGRFKPDDSFFSRYFASESVTHLARDISACFRWHGVCQ